MPARARSGERDRRTAVTASAGGPLLNRRILAAYARLSAHLTATAGDGARRSAAAPPPDDGYGAAPTVLAVPAADFLRTGSTLLAEECFGPGLAGRRVRRGRGAAAAGRPVHRLPDRARAAEPTEDDAGPPSSWRTSAARRAAWSFNGWPTGVAVDLGHAARRSVPGHHRARCTPRWGHRPSAGSCGPPRTRMSRRTCSRRSCAPRTDPPSRLLVDCRT